MIEEFLKCPKSFHSKYILHPDKKEESVPLLYGSGVHLTLKTHFEGGDPFAVWDMYWNMVKLKELDYGRDSWDYLNDITKTKFLPNFLKLHAKKFTDTKQEQTIGMNLSRISDRVRLQGTYDMLCDYEGVPTLVDWKTSAREYKQEKLERNPQLYIYAALCKHAYGSLPKQLMYKVFIKGEGRIQTLKIDLTETSLQLQMENVYSIVEQMLQMIESNSYYCNYNNQYCNHKG